MKPILKYAIGTVAAVAIVAISVIMMVDCGHNPDKITERQILKLVNQNIEDMAQNVFFEEVKVGTYECNSASSRHVLRELEAAGIIDYSVERYAWWEKSMREERVPYQVEVQGYWSSWTETHYKWEYRPYFEFCDHYVVNTVLTSKGKRLSVESRPEPKNEDEDMVSKEVDPSEYVWNQEDLSEDWPAIPNPFNGNAAPETASSYNGNYDDDDYGDDYYDSSYSYDYDDDDDYNDIERNSAERYMAYKAIEEDYDFAILKSFEVDAIIARNIYIVEREGIKYAHAEVICSTVNTTDVGRVLDDMEDDMRFKLNVKFRYYLDKGWVLCDDIDF